MFGAVCFPEVPQNASFCDKERRFLTKCMPPAYDDYEEYESQSPTQSPTHSTTQYPPFDDGGWIHHQFAHHHWEANDTNYIELMNKGECGENTSHSRIHPDRMYLEWCETPDHKNENQGSFNPCITEKSFEQEYETSVSEVVRDLVYIGLPSFAFILTLSTTLVLVKFFRRSKRILVYINMFLSMSLFSLCYVINIWIYRLYANMRKEESKKIIDVLGGYIDSLFQRNYNGENGINNLTTTQHDLFLKPDFCDRNDEHFYKRLNYTRADCSTLEDLDRVAREAGCGWDEFNAEKSTIENYCIFFGLLEAYFWMTKFTWFILQAIYLVMLNLCTYNSLSIFQSNMFIWIGWLTPLPFLAAFASNFFFSKGTGSIYFD
ncbi:Oidioi.mRNA.OKI2018_I69.XSR.g14819.t1.cds [Oikopleura dioica]|uniref:Oidioi.mRNA.OKI2018_I69.XSR.g14819.t1.cds n=1 Tax=Oikopleura dioica TaxID=34765 RepID=A0ABN7SI90_OIKDI|nr:Oidioi.mRNA.OKI2018_I69.XSR.g14819.t1.cds [Oikopleura dioica]